MDWQAWGQPQERVMKRGGGAGGRGGGWVKPIVACPYPYEMRKAGKSLVVPPLWTLPVNVGRALSGLARPAGWTHVGFDTLARTADYARCTLWRACGFFAAVRRSCHWARPSSAKQKTASNIIPFLHVHGAFMHVQKSLLVKQSRKIGSLSVSGGSVCQKKKAPLPIINCNRHPQCSSDK